MKNIWSIYLKNLVQLILSPKHGWDDLADESAALWRAHEKDVTAADRSDAITDENIPDSDASLTSDPQAEEISLSPEQWDERLSDQLALRCFLPLVVVSALSPFVRMIYNPQASFIPTLLVAISTVVSLGVAYFVARIAMQTLAPAWCRVFEDPDNPGAPAAYPYGRWNMVALFALSYLALIFMVSNLIKVRVAVLDFLPLYALYMIGSSRQFACIKERDRVNYFILMGIAILGIPYLISFILGWLF